MIKEKYALYKKYVEGVENIEYQVLLIYKALCEIHKQLKELDPVEYERASKTWLPQIDAALENREGILVSPDNLLKTLEAIERRIESREVDNYIDHDQLEIKVKEFEEADELLTKDLEKDSLLITLNEEERR
jgi:thiamine kinase-like enzyme